MECLHIEKLRFRKWPHYLLMFLSTGEGRRVAAKPKAHREAALSGYAGQQAAC